MRRYVFKKANYLLSQTKITNESEHQIFLKVGRFQVILKYMNHKLIGLCNCKAGSLKTPCAHIFAAITHITNGHGLNRETKTSIEGTGELSMSTVS